MTDREIASWVEPLKSNNFTDRLRKLDCSGDADSEGAEEIRMLLVDVRAVTKDDETRFDRLISAIIDDIADRPDALSHIVVEALFSLHDVEIAEYALAYARWTEDIVPKACRYARNADEFYHLLKLSSGEDVITLLDFFSLYRAHVSADVLRFVLDAVKPENLATTFMEKTLDHLADQEVHLAVARLKFCREHLAPLTFDDMKIGSRAVLVRAAVMTEQTTDMMLGFLMDLGCNEENAEQCRAEETFMIACRNGNVRYANTLKTLFNIPFGAAKEAFRLACIDTTVIEEQVVHNLATATWLSHAFKDFFAKDAHFLAETAAIAWDKGRICAAQALWIVVYFELDGKYVGNEDLRTTISTIYTQAPGLIGLKTEKIQINRVDEVV